MKLLLALILLYSFSSADILKDFVNKKYNEVCNYKNVLQYTKNEKILSIIGFSCLKIDKLFVLPAVVKRLKKTSLGQKNAVYFSTIYLQKKLLLAHFFDNYPLDGFNFPKSDYLISVVFDHIKSRNYTKEGDKFIINTENASFVVFKDKDKLVINEVFEGKVLKNHWFR